DGDTEDWRKDRLWAIDVVHIDYLDAYVAQHLRPFADAFGRLALNHHEELAAGEGFVTGLGENSYTDLEPRLRPRPVMQRASRGLSIAGRIASFPYWLWKSR